MNYVKEVKCQGCPEIELDKLDVIAKYLIENPWKLSVFECNKTDRNEKVTIDAKFTDNLKDSWFRGGFYDDHVKIRGFSWYIDILKERSDGFIRLDIIIDGGNGNRILNKIISEQYVLANSDFDLGKLVFRECDYQGFIKKPIDCDLSVFTINALNKP